MTLRKKKAIAIILSILINISVIYSIAVFSNIPFIEKWRTIYIETAMSTMDHQWLATKFIPSNIVNSVMNAREKTLQAQDKLKSNWENESKALVLDAKAVDIKEAIPMSEQATFFNTFSELDKTTFEDYVNKHPEVVSNGYASINIDESGLKSKGTSIKTVQGDQVLAIDSANGILIIKVTGEGYTGKLAIIKDAARVCVAPASKLGSMGESVANIVKKNNAILGINSSGFKDIGGHGNGGTPVGLVISDHNTLSESANNNYMVIGFKDDNRLYIGHFNDHSEFRDAVEFYPMEVINGQNVTDGSTGFGIQPRTSIGQASNGDVLLLTVDGRQIGYSLGCTVGDCAEIMLRYNCLQACNLDGGSSTVMVYKGREITKPANGCSFGRYVPDSIIVK